MLSSKNSLNSSFLKSEFIYAFIPTFDHPTISLIAQAVAAPTYPIAAAISKGGKANPAIDINWIAPNIPPEIKASLGFNSDLFISFSFFLSKTVLISFNIFPPCP